MSEVDLANDVAEARDAIKPLVDRLLGLLQMWHMFQSAKVVADEYHSKFDDLSYQLKIACTRSLVVDYLKPWSGNYSPEINSLKVCKSAKNWSYPFLEPIVRTDMHEQLNELRSSIVAHLDRDFEGGGVTLKGTRIANVRSSGKQDVGTIDDVFLPTIAVLVGRRGLWWLSSKEKIGELCEHIDDAKGLVEEEIRNTAALFRETCIDHMHVVDQLTDLFGIIESPIVAGNVDVTTHAEDPRPLSGNDPIELKIGNQHIQSLATVYEPRPEYPTNVDIKGKGYRLKIGEMSDNGQLQFVVSFPKYPHPKGD